MTILDQLAEHAGERVSEAKRKISPKDLKQQALSMQKGSCSVWSDKSNNFTCIDIKVYSI